MAREEVGMIGQAEGDVTNDPERMWAIWVGKLFKPSKICVASISTLAWFTMTGGISHRMVAPLVSLSRLRKLSRSSRTRTSKSTVTWKERIMHRCC